MAMARTGMLEGLSDEQKAFVSQRSSSIRKERKEVSKEVSNLSSSKFITFSSKMEEELWNSLRKVALSRKIAKIPLATQQEIINVAVAEWLERNSSAE